MNEEKVPCERGLMSESELMKLINAMVEKYGSQAEVADKLKISRAYLNDYLSGRRQAGGKILSALELRRVITYESTAKR
jgi:predicted transcriptional regulator